MFSPVLKTKGAVQEIGGAEFKLSTQQRPPSLAPPPHLPSLLYPHLLSYPQSLLLLHSVLAVCQRTHHLL